MLLTSSQLIKHSLTRPASRVKEDNLVKIAFDFWKWKYFLLTINISNAAAIHCDEMPHASLILYSTWHWRLSLDLYSPYTTSPCWIWSIEPRSAQQDQLEHPTTREWDTETRIEADSIDYAPGADKYSRAEQTYRRETINTITCLYINKNKHYKFKVVHYWATSAKSCDDCDKVRQVINITNLWRLTNFKCAN